MKKTPILIIIVLTVAVLTYICVDMFMKWHETELASTQEELRIEYDQKLTGLEEKVDSLEKALADERSIYPSAERLNDAFGRDVTDMIFSDASLNPAECQAAKEALISFFYYLDNSGYSDRYSLKDGMFTYYKQTLSALSTHPPAFVSESAEVLTLMRSMSHFSRVLGRKGALILKDILENETDMIEPAIALTFRLFEQDPACPESIPIPSLSKAYEYAYFFLNTLSGKSYLMRRNSKLRILADYYALRVIRLAETRSLNRYGLDPRAKAELLIRDMEHHRGLMYKTLYIDHLTRIIEAKPSALISEPDTATAP